MIINDFSEKGKKGLNTVLSVLIGILTLAAGGGIYSIIKLKAETLPLRVEYTQYAVGSESVLQNTVETRSTSTTTGAFVASKSGKAYYLPWCAAAGRILEKNKVWFSTKEEAEKAGYTPAKNCKGL